jgi:hypothetical protein
MNPNPLGMGPLGMGGMGMGMPGIGMGMNGMGPLGMAGMGMNGMGPLGMGGMNMFTPEGRAWPIHMSFMQQAMQLDTMAGKLSPREFSQSLLKLLFQYKAALWQSKHPLPMLLVAGAAALFGSNKVKPPDRAARRADALAADKAGNDPAA